MSDSLISSPLVTLRESIDALALEVTLHDLDSPEQIQPLARKIQREAEAADMPAIAAIAIELNRAPTGQTLRDAVSRMQQLLVPVAPAPLNQDPELVADFILEAREHLSTVESQLLALEQDPSNLEAINTIFRGFHTIKGVAGFLEFDDHPAVRARSRDPARSGPQLQTLGRFRSDRCHPPQRRSHEPMSARRGGRPRKPAAGRAANGAHPREGCLRNPKSEIRNPTSEIRNPTPRRTARRQGRHRQARLPGGYDRRIGHRTISDPARSRYGRRAQRAADPQPEPVDSHHRGRAARRHDHAHDSRRPVVPAHGAPGARPGAERRQTGQLPGEW